MQILTPTHLKRKLEKKKYHSSPEKHSFWDFENYLTWPGHYFLRNAGLSVKLFSKLKRLFAAPASTSLPPLWVLLTWTFLTLMPRLVEIFPKMSLIHIVGYIRHIQWWTPSWRNKVPRCLFLGFIIRRDVVLSQ